MMKILHFFFQFLDFAQIFSRFYTNGANERVRIDVSGFTYFNSCAYFGALDNSGLRIDKTSIFSSIANTTPIKIDRQSTSC